MKECNNMHYVYILKCSDDTYYTGWTTDINRRLLVHQDKKGAKYTKARIPVELVYFETFNTKSEALKREIAIKKLTREKKILLIKGELDEHT